MVSRQVLFIKYDALFRASPETGTYVHLLGREFFAMEKSAIEILEWAQRLLCRKAINVIKRQAIM
jgi:hypothetical protein